MDGLKDILDKLSSYNIFNYLLPGILFVVIAEEFSGHNFIIENNFLGAFLYYFIGMVISRIGSLVIEPLLKLIKFLKFKDYKDFVHACKKDEKIELLSEVNNTYRTLLSMLISLVILRLFDSLATYYDVSHDLVMIIIVSFLLILFLFSYRKQTSYISKRVDANK